MGFLKKLFGRVAKNSVGIESFNPYVGMLLKADPSDLIADEKFRLSMILRSGAYGVTQNAARAKEYCRIAAEEGHPCAQVMYVQWLMTKPDEHTEEILGWLSKAADQGEKQALYNVGISYHRGDFGEPDIQKANSLIKASAEKGYGNALSRMAMIYLNGMDGEMPSKPIAKFYAMEGHFHKDQMSHEILLSLLDEDEKQKGEINIQKVIKDACDAGVPLAIVASAGFKAQENIEEGIKILESMKGDCARKEEVLGVLYSRKEEYVKAIPYLEISSEKGDDEAQRLLAEIYYFGKGVNKNIAKALEYVLKAINLGNNGARALFAQMIMSNDLQELLPDKVLRGPSYLELSGATNS